MKPSFLEDVSKLAFGWAVHPSTGSQYDAIFESRVVHVGFLFTFCFAVNVFC
jgi:hypothetical protein